MFYAFLVLSTMSSGLEITSPCVSYDVKSILEGCKRLSGLNVSSVGGTVINDHNCDVLLPKQVFTEEPLFQFSTADARKFYTIMMIDPDAEPNIKGLFYLHMLKSNVPGLALKDKDSSKIGVDYRGYQPPAPSEHTGVHRYITLLYEQEDGDSFLPTMPITRNRFALAHWLHGKHLCGPVAGTQFRAHY